MNSEFYSEYFCELHSCIQSVSTGDLIAAEQVFKSVYDAGGTIYVVGNGGSAAMASHVATDLTKGAGLRATCFGDAGLITCFANDYGYENWVAQAVKRFANPEDCLVAISSSGQSPNILNGVDAARSKGMPIITFSGFQSDNPLRSKGQLNFWVNSTVYNYVEMAHHCWLVSIVDSIGRLKLPVNNA